MAPHRFVHCNMRAFSFSPPLDQINASPVVAKIFAHLSFMQVGGGSQNSNYVFYTEHRCRLSIINLYSALKVNYRFKHLIESSKIALMVSYVISAH